MSEFEQEEFVHNQSQFAEAKYGFKKKYPVIKTVKLKCDCANYFQQQQEIMKAAGLAPGPEDEESEDVKGMDD